MCDDEMPDKGLSLLLYSTVKAVKVKFNLIPDNLIQDTVDLNMSNHVLQ